MQITTFEEAKDFLSKTIQRLRRPIEFETIRPYITSALLTYAFLRAKKGELSPLLGLTKGYAEFLEEQEKERQRALSELLQHQLALGMLGIKEEMLRERLKEQREWQKRMAEMRQKWKEEQAEIKHKREIEKIYEEVKAKKPTEKSRKELKKAIEENIGNPSQILNEYSNAKDKLPPKELDKYRKIHAVSINSAYIALDQRPIIRFKTKPTGRYLVGIIKRNGKRLIRYYPVTEEAFQYWMKFLRPEIIKRKKKREKGENKRISALEYGANLREIEKAFAVRRY